MNGTKILLAFVFGFVFAQGIKVAVALIQGKKDIAKYLMKSGGMPSGHAASLVAVSMCLGLTEGFGSAVFALAVCVTLVVIYDAINVRYAVGEQGKALNELIKKPLKVVEGHVLAEVLAGILIGILVGSAVFLIF